MTFASRAQRGVALVEFAVAVPLLMLLLVGVVEFGRLTYYSILVGNAAHAGAAYGSQNLATAVDGAKMRAAAMSDGQNVPQLSVPAANALCQCYNGSIATTLSCFGPVTCSAGYHRVVYVQVTATGTVKPLFNYRPLGLPDLWSISRTATMRVGGDTP